MVRWIVPILKLFFNKWSPSSSFDLRDNIELLYSLQWVKSLHLQVISVKLFFKLHNDVGFGTTLMITSKGYFLFLRIFTRGALL